MTILANAQPFPLFFDKAGVPLSGGSVYFGQPNQNPETAPVTVYWDVAGTQPAPQPLKTVGGYIARNGTPALAYIDGDYSMTVKAKNGSVLFYAPSASSLDNSQVITSLLSSSSGSNFVGFSQSNSYNTGTVGYEVKRAVRAESPSGYAVMTQAGAVRRSAGLGGSWSLINDSGHEPIGVSSVTQPDNFSYRLNYAQNYSKVGTIISVIDAELSPYGIHTGASGATDGATFNMYAPCRLYVDGRASVSASPLWTTQTGPITTPDAATVTITHANRALAVDPPIVTPITPSGVSRHRSFQVSWTATSTTITSLDEIQGLAISNGTTFSLSDCPNLGVSIAWNAGALTITHPDVTGHNIVELTALSSTLRPVVASVTGTTTVIEFRDTAGNAVGPAQTAQMKVYFRRAALVPSTMDTGVRYGVDLGLCRVACDDVGNISLNNFWFIGFQNK